MSIAASTLKSTTPINACVDLPDYKCSIGVEWREVSSITSPPWVKKSLKRSFAPEDTFISTAVLSTYAKSLTGWDSLSLVRELLQNTFDHINEDKSLVSINSSAEFVDRGNFSITIDPSADSGAYVRFSNSGSVLKVLVAQKWKDGGRLTQRHLSLGTDKNLGEHLGGFGEGFKMGIHMFLRNSRDRSVVLFMSDVMWRFEYRNDVLGVSVRKATTMVDGLIFQIVDRKSPMDEDYRSSMMSRFLDFGPKSDFNTLVNEHSLQYTHDPKTTDAFGKLYLGGLFISNVPKAAGFIFNFPVGGNVTTDRDRSHVKYPVASSFIEHVVVEHFIPLFDQHSEEGGAKYRDPFYEFIRKEISLKSDYLEFIRFEEGLSAGERIMLVDGDIETYVPYLGSLKVKRNQIHPCWRFPSEHKNVESIVREIIRIEAVKIQDHPYKPFFDLLFGTFNRTYGLFDIDPIYHNVFINANGSLMLDARNNLMIVPDSLADPMNFLLMINRVFGMFGGREKFTIQVHYLANALHNENRFSVDFLKKCIDMVKSDDLAPVAPKRTLPSSDVPVPKKARVLDGDDDDVQFVKVQNANKPKNDVGIDIMTEKEAIVFKAAVVAHRAKNTVPPPVNTRGGGTSAEAPTGTKNDQRCSDVNLVGANNYFGWLWVPCDAPTPSERDVAQMRAFKESAEALRVEKCVQALTLETFDVYMRGKVFRASAQDKKYDLVWVWPAEDCNVRGFTYCDGRIFVNAHSLANVYDAGARLRFFREVMCHELTHNIVEGYTTGHGDVFMDVQTQVLLAYNSLTDKIY